MRTSPPTLLPIFRSDGQARLLARVFLRPDEPTSLADLARDVGLDPASVQREVTRLESAGILKTERIGGARIVHPNILSPIYDEIDRLVLKTLGPAVLLSRTLKDVAGVHLAFVFGSWAERIAGRPGPAPQDVDLLVVGTPDRRALSKACRAAAEQLGRDVNPVVVSEEDWEVGATGFVRSVRGGTLVPVDLPNGSA